MMAIVQMTAAAVLRRTAVRVRARRSDRRSCGAEPGMALRRLCMPSTTRRISRRANQFRTRATTTTVTIFEIVSRCQSSRVCTHSGRFWSGIVPTVPRTTADGPDPQPLDTVAGHGRFPVATGRRPSHAPPRPTAPAPTPAPHVAATLVITGSTLMAMVCVVAAIGVWYANDRLQDLERVVITHASTITVAGTDPSAGTAAAPVTVDTTPGDAQNFLLIGSDSRKDACTDPNSPFAGGLGTVTSNLSDTIILVRVDPATSQAAILSFPRDLWVTVSGTGRKAKINSAYQPDNPSRLVQTIEENFGVFVDHTVQVSLCAFKALVDAVGGVKVPFAFPTRDDTTGFSVDAGCITLDGDQALAYVRSRKDYQYMDDKGWHTDPTSDYGRIARQQDFISRALQKAVDKGARNVNVARDLLDVALSNVVVDQNLTINDLLRLAVHAARLRPGAAPGPQLPGRGPRRDPGRRERHHPRRRGAHDEGHPRGLPRQRPAVRHRPDRRLRAPRRCRMPRARRPPRPATASHDHARARHDHDGAPGPTTTPAPGATTTLPVVDVAPNPLGISPPDDPTCR